MDNNVNKLFSLVQARILKGEERIKELSVFEGKLNLTQISAIDKFQKYEHRFAENVRNRLLLLTLGSKQSPDLLLSLEGLLTPYLNQVHTFPQKFPV